jgi:hypothetical protein
MNITPEMLNYGQFDGDIGMVYLAIEILIVWIGGTLLFMCLDAWEKHKKKRKHGK